MKRRNVRYAIRIASTGTKYAGGVSFTKSGRVRGAGGGAGGGAG